MSVQGTRVLCIDDDPDVIEILTKYLVPEGYSVIGANSGDEGIKLALEHAPALITLDIMMPQKDGWQVLRELKANNTLKDIPVIIHSIIDNKPLAISLGAIDVIAKPAEPKRLLSLVQRASGSGERFVLVVDDNEDFTLAVKGLLQTEGFKVEIANDGARAFEILRYLNTVDYFSRPRHAADGRIRGYSTIATRRNVEKNSRCCSLGQRIDVRRVGKIKCLRERLREKSRIHAGDSFEYYKTDSAQDVTAGLL